MWMHNTGIFFGMFGGNSSTVCRYNELECIYLKVFRFTLKLEDHDLQPVYCTLERITLWPCPKHFIRAAISPTFSLAALLQLQYSLSPRGYLPHQSV